MVIAPYLMNVDSACLQVGQEVEVSQRPRGSKMRKVQVLLRDGADLLAPPPGRRHTPTIPGHTHQRHTPHTSAREAVILANSRAVCAQRCLLPGKGCNNSQQKKQTRW